MVMESLNDVAKLIDRPGFAVLLNERIAIAAERYADLEKAAGELEAENLRIKLENFKLKEKVESLERQLAKRCL